jgi:hypothetical protein
MGNLKGFPTSYSNTFFMSYDVFVFLSNVNMLSATTVAAEFAKIYPKLPKFAIK